MDTQDVSTDPDSFIVYFALSIWQQFAKWFLGNYNITTLHSLS